MAIHESLSQERIRDWTHFHDQEDPAPDQTRGGLFQGRLGFGLTVLLGKADFVASNLEGLQCLPYGAKSLAAAIGKVEVALAREGLLSRESRVGRVRATVQTER